MFFSSGLPPFLPHWASRPSPLGASSVPPLSGLPDFRPFLGSCPFLPCRVFMDFRPFLGSCPFHPCRVSQIFTPSWVHVRSSLFGSSWIFTPRFALRSGWRNACGCSLIIWCRAPPFWRPSQKDVFSFPFLRFFD